MLWCELVMNSHMKHVQMKLLKKWFLNVALTRDF